MMSISAAVAFVFSCLLAELATMYNNGYFWSNKTKTSHSQLVLPQIPLK